MRSRIFLVLLLCHLLLPGQAFADLGFQIDQAPVVSVSLVELQKKFTSHSIELFDPFYKKKKKYKAFKVKDLLASYFGAISSSPSYDLVFKTKDGYQAIATTQKLTQEGGYLAFQDLENPHFLPIGRLQTDPSPFYLVWLGKKQTVEFEYPWPWAVIQISIVNNEKSLPQLKTQGSSDLAQRGFKTFKYRCLRCHQIYDQGGKIGPNLTQPKNILDYRSIDEIKNFIKDPAQFRESKMPSHKDLSSNQLEEIVQYFWELRNNRPGR